MSITPYSPQTAAPGWRWSPRVYPRVPTGASRVRSELRADLELLTNVTEDLVSDMVLCASEMFSSAVEHVGADPRGGRMLRTLTLYGVPGRGSVLCLSMVGEGARSTVPHFPCEGLPGVWPDVSLGQGLVLIDRLSERWGTRRALFPDEGVGAAIWAELTVPAE